MSCAVTSLLGPTEYLGQALAYFLCAPVISTQHQQPIPPHQTQHYHHHGCGHHLCRYTLLILLIFLVLIANLVQLDESRICTEEEARAVVSSIDYSNVSKVKHLLKSLGNFARQGNFFLLLLLSLLLLLLPLPAFLLVFPLVYFLFIFVSLVVFLLLSLLSSLHSIFSLSSISLIKLLYRGKQGRARARRSSCSSQD